MGSLLDFLFRCAHRNLSRPMTPVHKPGSSAPTYVVCLDCGKQFAYDWKEMRLGSCMRAETGVDPGFADSKGV
jgi:hypothetical protein